MGLTMTEFLDQAKALEVDPNKKTVKAGFDDSELFDIDHGPSLSQTKSNIGGNPYNKEFQGTFGDSTFNGQRDDLSASHNDANKEYAKYISNFNANNNYQTKNLGVIKVFSDDGDDLSRGYS